MLKDFYSEHLDSYGLICKRGDGGDTCANVFTALYAGQGSALDVRHALEALVSNGIPIRHPDPTKWYSYRNRTSRDQLTPYLCFVASRPCTPEFKQLMLQHAKHAFLFAWNTRRNFVYADPVEHAIKATPDVKWRYGWKLPDICGPDIWSIYARALATKWPILTPLVAPAIFLGDLQNLFSVLPVLYRLNKGHTFGPTSQPNAVNHDQRNLTLKLHFAAHNKPNFVSKWLWQQWRQPALDAADSFWSQAHEPPIWTAIWALVNKS